MRSRETWARNGHSVEAMIYEMVCQISKQGWSYGYFPFLMTVMSISYSEAEVGGEQEGGGGGI